MTVHERTQAVMLLTASFGKSGGTRVRPLSAREWARFALWLDERDLRPEALLRAELPALLSDWTDRTVTLSRLEGLLGRGGALGLALDRWQRAGVWVLTRSDSEYPVRLKRRLGGEAPPVLFGCGNERLLDRGGIAVVGARDADEDDIAFAETIGTHAAEQGHSVVSGGARGVDRSAMQATLERDGTAVGMLADGLLRAAMSAAWRKRLLSGDLVLTSAVNPEAGFHVGHAMTRNRYVYCLSDAVVVVASAAGRGGTWNGAIDGLKGGWVPVWARRNRNTSSGNPELVARGARWLPEPLASLDSLLRAPRVAPADTLPLFATSMGGANG